MANYNIDAIYTGSLAGTERIRIDGSGNVGIGTTSPFGTTTNRTCVSVNGITDVSLNVGTGGSQRAYLYASASLGQVGTIGAIPLILAPNDTERARITSDGDVLIGRTATGGLNGRIVVTKNSGKASIGTQSTNGTGAMDTGISVNQAEEGGCMLLLASRNTGSGTNTEAAVYIVRFYYDGNNTPTTVFVGGSSDFVSFGKSASNTLTLTNAGSGNVTYSWFGNK